MIRSLAGQGINVQQACVALGVSQSGYYAWIDRPDAPRTLRRIWLAGEIADVHKESGGTYGAMRITAELKYGRGIAVGHCAVGDIMRQIGLKGLPRRRLPRGAKLSRVTSLDLVGRKFKRDRPNELWFTDITEHPTREGKVYCCVVLDTYSRKVVGWSIDSTQTTSLVLNALGMATQRRPDRDGLVMHSDRGVQFSSWAFSHNLSQAGISPSMGAVGSAFDNALMESFWGRMQVELLDRRKWKTRIELATAIHDYIELWHNPRRRHSALGMRTPDEVENAWLQANTPATVTTGPALQTRAAAGASARLRRASAPTADTTDDVASETAVTITNDTNHAA
ncbi:MAG: IS3 family transposase [Mycobacterium sp.]